MSQTKMKAGPKLRPIWLVTFVDVDDVRRPLVDADGVAAFITRREALDMAKLAREEDEDAGCWTDIKVVRFEAVR